MNALITGGGGFLGLQLAVALLRNSSIGGGRGLSSLTLADLHFSQPPPAGGAVAVEAVTGDLGDPDFVGRLIRPDTGLIFHLAAMVSGDGERDFDGCLRTNLDGTRALLEQARRTGRCPRMVFASSLAVFGGHAMEPVVSDRTKPIPQTTYGMTKLIGELLINDYSRKGFVDGRAARLPTVFIRPGRPNAAASSFASALFREPLAGRTCLLPVSRSQRVPLLGYRRVVANLIRLADCEADRLGSDRTVTLPSTPYEIAEMITALERVAAWRQLRLGSIVDQPDERIMEIVQSWPVATDATRVEGLGLESDPSVEQVIEEYIEDFGG